MEDTEIKFDAPAVLRKWPSLKNERVGASLGAYPYTVFDGSLDNCIRQFMAKSASRHHLYEIHTASQGELIIPVLSAKKHSRNCSTARFFKTRVRTVQQRCG